MSMTNYPGGFPGGVALYQQVQTLGDGSGSTYFCDGNSGNDGNNGSSWEDAFKTLAVAFAASHADIARGSDRWARRNTIYIAGDAFVEDLEIFPQKTDVIGVGSVSGNKYARITGDHAPVNAGVGCRFINCAFDPTSAGVNITLTGACWGAEFIGCKFYYATAAVVATCAILSTASPHLHIEGCDFMGAYSGDVIDIAAGDIAQTRIIGNTIIGGANDGIVVSGVATCAGSKRGLIADNYISVVGKTIDTRATSVFDVVNNRLMSATALLTPSDVFVIDRDFASGNLVAGAGVTITIPTVDT